MITVDFFLKIFLTTATCYLGGAFVSGTFNAGRWNPYWKAALVVLWVLCCFSVIRA